MLANALGTQYDANGSLVAGDVGSAAPTGAIQVAGSDGANLRALLTDATGKLITTSSVSDTTSTGALAALNSTVALALAGQGGAGFDLAAGTFQGTLVPEISYDNTSWEQTYFEDPTTGIKTSSMVFAANNTHQARSIYCPIGAGFARVRVSVATSGTANATIRASTVDGPMNLTVGPSGSAAPPLVTQTGGLNAGNLIATAVDASGRQIVVGPAASGAAPVGNPVYIAGLGTDANLHSISTDASGRQIVVGSTATGAALSGNAVPVAGVTSAGNVEPLLVDAQGRIVQIEQKSGTAAQTSVAAAVTTTQLLAANANRLGATIYNNSNAKLFINVGAAANTTTAFVVLLGAGGYWEVPFDYTGVINGIWSAANGNAVMGEFTN